MFKRLRNLFRMLFSFLIEDAEDRVPLERRLAFDRQERSRKIDGMKESAISHAERAEMLVQRLAEANIKAANRREEIKMHLTKAKNAKSKEAEEEELANAAILADDLAEWETYREDLQEDVDDSFAEKQENIRMISQQVRDLEMLAGKDDRTVAKVYMAKMKEERARLRESMLGLIPERDDDFRQKAEAKASRMVASSNAREEITNALWKAKKEGQIARNTQTSARASQLLRDLGQEVGYAPTEEPAVVEASSANDLKKQIASMQGKK